MNLRKTDHTTFDFMTCGVVEFELGEGEYQWVAAVKQSIEGGNNEIDNDTFMNE